MTDCSVAPASAVWGMASDADVSSFTAGKRVVCMAREGLFGGGMDRPSIAGGKGASDPASEGLIR